MTILRARATPLATALCLVLAAPAANAAGFMYFKDSPIVGELPPAPKLATPTKPSAGANGQGYNDWRTNFGSGPSAQLGDGDVDGRDFLVWQRGSSPSPKPGPAQKFQAPGKLKLK